MNKRIEKVREDIRLAEKRLAEMNEYLKTLRLKEKKLCDEEILKTMRSMAGKGGDVMELLSKITGEQEDSSDDVSVKGKEVTITEPHDISESKEFMAPENTDDYEEEIENENDQ